MSELEERSEPKRELKGIARAVDALFSPPFRPPAVEPGEDAEVPSLDHDAASRDAPVSVEPPPLAATEPADDGGPGFADVHPLLSDQPPRLPSDISPSGGGDRDGTEAGAPLRPSTHASAARQPLLAVPPELGSEDDAGAASGGDAEAVLPPGERTPLDDAVASLLDGGGSAQQVTTLADELLEQNALDPVARAVASLVSAAGEPPDAGLLAIAERLMSPVVLGRLVRRMAADPDRRVEYVQVARTIGRSMAAAIRDDVAQSVEPVVREGHVAALMGLGEQARAVVHEMAESDNRFLVRTGVEVLGTLGGVGALPLIRDALTNADARVRSQSLRSLQALQDRESASLIIAMLEDADLQVRTTAAAVAADFGLERAVGRITALLDQSTTPDETIDLLEALGRLGDPGAVPSIEKHAVRTLFSKPPTEVRIAAYRALHRIGTPHAKELIRQAVADKDPRVGAAVNELVVGET